MQLADWGLATVVFLFTFLVIRLVRSRIRARRERWHAMDKLPRLELLSLLVAKTSRLVLLVLALYLAGRILTQPLSVELAFNVVIIIGVWIQAGIWATTAGSSSLIFRG